MWFEKYSPSNIKEIISQRIEPLIKHARLNPKGKALLIYGPSGTGKTSSVQALARGEGYELVEVNASSLMNAEIIKTIIGNASLTMSLFGKRIILIDDIDSLSVKDRGGITELIKVIKKTRTPIFITATDPWNPKLRTIRGYCELIEFKKIRASSIKELLKKIALKENIKVTDQILYRLASQANGDVRAAINNLEMLSGDGEVTEYELEAMGYREKPVTIFNALQTLFKTRELTEAIHSLDDVELDLNTKMLWITENITNEFKTSKELSKAFNMLSRADVFNGRIMKRQYWRFLVYVNLLITAGINLSREHESGFVKYQRPTKILRLWQTKSKRELRKQLALKLKKGFKTSIKKILKTLPYIKLLLKNKEITNYYELTIDELKSIN